MRPRGLANTHVTDLTPLGDMPLKVLSFTPRAVVKGVEAIRRMKTIQKIGCHSSIHVEPAEFWKKYDAGELK